MTAMTPMAFTDVLCACSNVPDNLVGIHWYKNKLQNNSNVRANSNWYYVVGTHGTGEPREWATYEKALKYVATDRVEEDYDGSLLAIWNDYNNPFTAEEVANVKTLIRTQATSNPDYFTVEQPEQPDPDYDKEIRVVIGQTSEITIEDVNYANNGPYTTDDPSIATVEVTGTDEVPASPNYSKISSMKCTTLLDNNETRHLTDYYYKVNEQYYPLYVTRTGNLTWGAGTRTYTYEYSTDGGQTFQLIQTQKVTFAAGINITTDVNIPLYERGVDTPVTPASTTITFTGVNPGTTYVTVGDTRYTILVTAEDLSRVTPLTYHPWISTFAVSPEGTGKTNCQGEEGKAVNATIAASDSGVYREQGAAISTLVAPTGDWVYEEEAQTVYWKATILPNGSHQEGNKAKDQSMSGTDFTYLRYWDKVWSYSSDRVNWTPVQSTDEVCAYYLQQTAVTKEVDTYVKDWAFTTQNAASNGGGGRSQKALSFAVVYPSGQMSPAEGDIYSTSTLVYFDNLDPLTFIRVGVNEVYEVEKITYTFGARQTSSSNTAWQANDSINWEKTTTGGATWYKETTCWDETYRTEPVVNGADLAEEINAGTPHRKTDIGNMTDYDGTWGANDAVLILIYLKPVVTEDSLTVRYWDDSANSEIYQYPVNITNTTGVEKGTFLNRLEQNSAVNSGEFTLDDTAYVVNAKNQNETFQKDLTKVPNLFGKYTSGLYNYVKADISADGKTLTLHYNLNADKLSKNFVLDFGLPVTIPLTEIAGKIDNVTGVTVTVPQSSANAVVNADRSITVTLSKAMTSAIPMTVTVTYNDNSTATFTVGLTPATTVYYEEGFATPYNSDATGGSKGTVAQTTEVVGKKQNVYGYDDAYNKVGDSNDSVMTLAAGKGAATFTFTGTGVDIYTRSTMETGSLMIRVMNSANKLVKVVSVNTVMKNGSSDSTSGQEVTAYNVPVVSLSGLTHGTYTLQIAAVKSGSAGAKDVYIDGFRVHGTLEDQSNSVYVADQEDNPTFVELRDEVLTAQNVNTDNSQYANQIAENVISQVYAVSNSTTGAVIMSNNTKLSDADMEDLLDNGPKNEIYLQPQQTLTFKISTNRVVQIGLKALNQATTYTINNDEKKPLNTSTDMFYTVLNKAESETEQTITITNTGNGILSITDLKVCDDPNATLGELTAEDLIPALVSLGFESEPVAATATLNITVQCGDKAVPVTLTHDGMSNETYTFTAAEIKAAVEQALPEGYTVADVTFSDVTVTCGEASDVAFTAAETPAPVGLLQKIVQIAVKIVKKIFSWF